MAKNMQPILKRCKTLGLSPAVLGYSKETKRNPKQSRRKQSEYGMQLAEKQKVKFIYGVLEAVPCLLREGGAQAGRYR